MIDDIISFVVPLYICIDVDLKEISIDAMYEPVVPKSHERDLQSDMYSTLETIERKSTMNTLTNAIYEAWNDDSNDNTKV